MTKRTKKTNSDIRIVKLQLKYVKDVCRLSVKTYKEFCAHEDTREAAQRYINHYNFNKNKNEVIRKYQSYELKFIALIEDTVVGIIAGSRDQINNLFVAGKYHHRGAGVLLYRAFEKSSIKKGSRAIKVDSSLYAIPFYKKMGFKKTTGVRSLFGLIYQPMKKIFK